MTDFEQKFGVTGYPQEAQEALLSANQTLEQSAAWRAFAKQSLNEYQSGAEKNPRNCKGVRSQRKNRAFVVPFAAGSRASGKISGGTSAPYNL